MKKFFALALFLTAAFASPVHLFAYSVSFDQKISVNQAPLAEFKVFIQDKNVRTEANLGGMPVVTIRNTVGAYNYFPERKIAQQIPTSMIRTNLTDDLPDFTAFLQKNKAQKVGQEKIDGKPTEIYQYTDPAMKGPTKIWLWVEKKFPLKIEVPSTAGVTRIEFTNVNFNPGISPSLFQVPEGVQITKIPTPEKPVVTPVPNAKATPQPKQAEAKK